MQLPDPHSYGSGNPGATNVLRTGNKLAAVLTLGACATPPADPDARGQQLRLQAPSDSLTQACRSLGLSAWLAA